MEPSSDQHRLEPVWLREPAGLQTAWTRGPVVGSAIAVGFAWILRVGRAKLPPKPPKGRSDAVPAMCVRLVTPNQAAPSRSWVITCRGVP